jgi:flagellar motor switch protein FliM
LADVLSQNEIDALLNAISSGAVDTASAQDDSPEMKVKTYDFRTAGRFSKEQLRTLTLIYENFARLFTTYLSGAMRAICQVDILSVEELKYQEFVNALPNPVVLVIISTPPLVGSLLLEISPDVAFSMISRLLGGGDVGHARESRSFTEIELVLIERVVRQFIRLFSEAWEKITPIEVSLERIETSAQFAQIVALNETVAIITLNVKIGMDEGLVNLCLPHLALEPVSKQLNTKLMFHAGAENRARTSMTDNIQHRIENTPLPISATFNPTQANVLDILSLQAGDVIQLEHAVGEDLTMKIGHLDKFRVSLGVKDNRYAVMISGVIQDEEAGV